MAKRKTLYVCQECGYSVPKWLGKCPGCGKWNTLVEELDEPSSFTNINRNFSLNTNKTNSIPKPIKTIETEDLPRFSAGSPEMNRVLGGGIIPGSLVLMVGDPGVGKSSLNLRICAYVAKKHKVLYVTGEESSRQIRMRADRLNALDDNLYVLSETDLERIERHVLEQKPDLLVIDSIQTIFRPDIQSAPGSVSQVRECSVNLLRIAKQNNIAIFIIGHVTKDGTLAGPRVLEHIVDTVLYFEGERNAEYRVLRAVKNRFGNTNEIGIFEMRENGLVDVPDASKMFLSEQNDNTSGTVIIPALEGTRPLLVEIQALVAPTPYVPPRRTSDSIDIKKIQLLLAVLEKRVHLNIGSCDVYVKVAGGIKIDDPAVDLALCCAMASSFRNQNIKPQTIIFGEVGLAGEVRSVSQPDIRVREAIRMGFTNIILPAKNLDRLEHSSSDVQIHGVRYLSEALKIAFN
jgi:DNA repair protein RadA/Sms